MKNIVITIFMITGACVAGVAIFGFVTLGGLYLKEHVSDDIWLMDYLGHAVAIAFFCAIIWPVFTFLAMNGSFRQLHGIMGRVRDARKTDPKFDLIWKKLIVRTERNKSPSNIDGIFRIESEE